MARSEPPSFISEKAARLHLEELLNGRFRLFPEVWLEHAEGNRVRIDYVALPLFPFFTEAFGVEVKRGYEKVENLGMALKQAIDYRECRIVDKRAKKWQGKRLPYVFMYPDSVQGAGAWTLARYFRVGAISTGRGRLQFLCGRHVIWDEYGGIKGMMKFFNERERRGAW